MSRILCPYCERPNSEFDYLCVNCGKHLPLDSLRGSASASPPDQGPTSVDETMPTLKRPHEPQPVADKMGHFEIIERIGQGGMGTVYKARDPRLKRFVAIKVLRRELDGSDGERSILLKEARTASSLNHPNIITIHDISRDNQADYMVMEWVDGQALNALIPPEGLPAATVIRHGLRIADGLARAHQAGVIHRDIKPANIMVTRADKIKILDFGLARARHDARGAAPDSDLPIDETVIGAIKGTIAYMSPEQTLGLSLNARSDIFSFGALLYRMLSGQRPFRQRHPSALMTAIREEAPRPLTELAPDVPADLANLVHKCLAKKCQDRPRTMDEVVAEIERMQTEATHRGSGFRFSRPVLFVLGFLLSLGLIFFLTRDPVETRIDKIAVLPFANISGDPVLQVFCDGLAGDLSNKLAGLEPVRPGSWIVPVDEVSRLGAPTAKELHDRFGVNRIISGRVEHQGPTRRLTLTLLDAEQSRQIDFKTLILPADQLFDAHSDILKSVIELIDWRLDPQTLARLFETQSQIPGAYRDYLSGLGFLYRYDQRAAPEQALTSFQSAIARDPDYLDPLLGAAAACLRLWQERTDPSWLAQAETFLQLAKKGHANHPEFRIVEGFLDLEKGKPERAETTLRSVWQDQPGRANAGAGLARALADQGKDDEAQQVFFKTMEERPNDWTIYNKLSDFYFRRGRYDQAGEIDQKLIEMTPNNMMGYYNLAEIMRIRGDFSGALAHLDLALQHRQTGSALMVANALTNKGVILFFQGRYDDAVAPFEEAAESTPARYRVWLNLADSYRWSSQRRNLAEPTYRKALQLIREQQKINPASQRLKAEAALCLAKTDRHQQALAELQDAPLPKNPYLIVKWATVSELAGNRAAALSYLEAALNANLPVHDIQGDPEFEALRQDPAYADLMKSIEI